MLQFKHKKNEKNVQIVQREVRMKNYCTDQKMHGLEI